MHDYKQRVTSVIILAGGLGTRLRSAVPDLPKPMAPVNGRPFLEHLLDYWIGQGISRFILSVGYKRGSIMEHFGNRYRTAVIEYAVEETPLGTGGGLLQAARLLSPDQPFLILNGDTFFEVSLPQLEKAHKEHDSGWTIALFRTSEPDRCGKISCAADGRIGTFSPDKAAPGDMANGGVYLVAPGALEGLSGTSLEQDILPGFIARGGRCYGVACSGTFFDIGIPQDYHKAASLLTF